MMMTTFTVALLLISSNKEKPIFVFHSPESDLGAHKVLSAKLSLPLFERLMVTQTFLRAFKPTKTHV